MKTLGIALVLFVLAAPAFADDSAPTTQQGTTTQQQGSMGQQGTTTQQGTTPQQGSTGAGQ